MKLKLIPSKLAGSVVAPSSKSVGHREIICAALAQGENVVDNVTLSKDIEATNRCLAALGVEVQEVHSRFAGRRAFMYTRRGKLRATQRVLDCGESGSTLRFLIPLGALLGEPVTFKGRGKLPSRPLKPYYEIFNQQNVSYLTAENGRLPLSVNGRLRPGEYELVGNVSSQFVSGLLFALPLLDAPSHLLVHAPIESASYIRLTLGALRKFRVSVEEKILPDGDWEFNIPGAQSYEADSNLNLVEGDWSQAAFWLAAGTLSGGVRVNGVNPNSLQGDMVVARLIGRMGGAVTQLARNVNTGSAEELAAALLSRDLADVFAAPRKTRAATIDAADCPDLVPVMTVLAALSEGTTHIVNAGRLRLKECDRLAAISTELNKLGARVTEEPEGLIIMGRPEGLEGGGEADAWNDHRIAMSLAVAACRCRQPFTLTGAEAVEKSYPEFWQDYRGVGGSYTVERE